MPNDTSTNPFKDLEDRTTRFARDVILLCRELPRGVVEQELIKQVVRAAGSVGANYREANETVGKKDFGYRIRIARKEAKECEHWLVLIAQTCAGFEDKTQKLVNEGRELRNIFSAILKKAV